jgi:GTP-binding protein
MFIDEVVVEVLAGHGGSGMAAFRREKFVPKGGPSGGDGGRGGSVYLVGARGLWTLLDYTYRRKWVAGSGAHGGPNQETGKSAGDVELPVPLGTTVRDADSGDVLGEVLADGERVLVAKGGRGGQGNQHFATPTHQAPHEYQPGEEGEHRRIRLTLKLIADVGLLGEPNAGKSTLLATVSAARPKIAAYPFTTLEPNLGVVQLTRHRSLVMADIPGIIEGAHAGKGLGLQFLRHVERTRFLVLMVPLDSPDLAAGYAMLREEARRYSAALGAKPHCVAWTKADLLPRDELPPLPPTPDAVAQFVISSVAHRGLEEFLEFLWRWLSDTRAAEAPATDPPVP